MRYIASVTNEGIIVSKGINYTEYVDEKEIELTEEQYNSIPIPCKLVDGEFVECDFPTPSVTEVEEVIPEPTETEQLRADVDFIAIMTGVDL